MPFVFSVLLLSFILEFNGFFGYDKSGGVSYLGVKTNLVNSNHRIFNDELFSVQR